MPTRVVVTISNEWQPAFRRTVVIPAPSGTGAAANNSVSVAPALAMGTPTRGHENRQGVDMELVSGVMREPMRSAIDNVPYTQRASSGTFQSSTTRRVGSTQSNFMLMEPYPIDESSPTSVEHEGGVPLFLSSPDTVFAAPLLPLSPRTNDSSSSVATWPLDNSDGELAPAELESNTRGSAFMVSPQGSFLMPSALTAQCRVSRWSRLHQLSRQPSGTQLAGSPPVSPPPSVHYLVSLAPMELIRTVTSLQKDRDISTALGTLPRETLCHLLDVLCQDVTLLVNLCNIHRGAVVCDLFELLGADDCRFLFRLIVGHLFAVVTTQRGVVAVVRILDSASLHQKLELANVLMDNLYLLAMDDNANFVVRRLVQHEEPELCTLIHLAFNSLFFSDAAGLLAAMIHKNASRVLEAYVSTTNGAVACQDAMLRALAQPSAAAHFASFPSAGFVLQSWLKRCSLTENQRAVLAQQLRGIGFGENALRSLARSSPSVQKPRAF